MNVKIDGAALLDFGFTDLFEVEGVGLLTNGFVFPCTSDWVPPAGSITTSWADGSGPSSTTWSANSNPIYGDDC